MFTSGNTDLLLTKVFDRIWHTTQHRGMNTYFSPVYHWILAAVCSTVMETCCLAQRVGSLSCGHSGNSADLHCYAADCLYRISSLMSRWRWRKLTNFRMSLNLFMFCKHMLESRSESVLAVLIKYKSLSVL